MKNRVTEIEAELNRAASTEGSLITYLAAWMAKVEGKQDGITDFKTSVSGMLNASRETVKVIEAKAADTEAKASAFIESANESLQMILGGLNGAEHRINTCLAMVNTLFEVLGDMIAGQGHFAGSEPASRDEFKTALKAKGAELMRAAIDHGKKERMRIQMEQAMGKRPTPAQPRPVTTISDEVLGALQDVMDSAAKEGK